MKRLLIIVFLFSFLLPGCFELIAQGSVKGGMVIQTTTVHKKKKEKKPKKEIEPVKPGFQHSLVAAFNTEFDDCFRGGLDYIAGYRFNRWLYAGVGLGLSFEDGDDYYYYYDYDDIRPEFTVPLYLHAKAYINLANKRYAPFFALSTGVNIASSVEVKYYDYWYSNGRYNSVTYFDKYNPTNIFVEPAIGFDYRLTSKISAYLQLGLNVHSVSYMNTFSTVEEKVDCENDAECDMSIKLGFVF